MSTRNTPSQETDVIDLYDLIKKIFNKLLYLFFRFINFLIRNIILIGILIVLGIVLGYFVDKNKQEFYKTEFIVATNFDDAEYLYKSIEEIKFGLKHYDDSFYEKIGISKDEGGKLNLEIEPILVFKELNKEEETYIEFLSDNIESEQKQRLFINSARRHKITVYHPKDINVSDHFEKIIEYIRDNEYYQELYAIYSKEATRQLESNINLVEQIDSLVINYSNSFKNEKLSSPGVTYFNSENALDLGLVLENRILIQDDISRLLENKVSSSTFLRIIDKGSPTPIDKFDPFGKKLIFYPILFVFIFIVIKIFKIIYRKAKANI